MYKVIKAVIRHKSAGSRLQEKDISQIPLNTLLLSYDLGYIELSHPSLRSNIYVTLDDLRSSSLPKTNKPFIEWLGSLGALTIEGRLIEPEITQSHVTFVDAFQGGFDVSRMGRHGQPKEGKLPVDMLTDVYLDKPMGHQTPIQQRVLTTINGLLHLNIPYQSGLQVIDAGRTLEVSQDNHIGIISFETIADVHQIRFDRKRMATPDPIYGLKSGVILDLDRDLTNVSLMVSIAGQLFGLDDTIEIINHRGLVRVNLYKLNLVELIQTSKAIIDLSSMQLDDTMHALGAICIADIIEQDEIIYKLLELTQSFIIIIDHPNVTLQTKRLDATGLDRIKEVNWNCRLPYRSDRGLLLAYWKRHVQGMQIPTTTLYLSNTHYTTPVHRTGLIGDAQWVSGIQEILPPAEDSGALLLIEAQTFRLYD